MQFGTQDTLECLATVSAPEFSAEPLCLAHKFHTYSVLLPVYLKDDGYVLKIRDSERYFDLNEEDIEYLQSEGIVATPLPSYSIDAIDYVFGYGLWFFLVIVAVYTWFATKRSKARDAADAAAPIGNDPLEILTKGDRYIEEQMAPLLRVNEKISHQVYATPTESNRSEAFFCAMTNERLVFITARVGAFGPILENKGNHSIERTDIEHVAKDDNQILVYPPQGDPLSIWINRKQNRFSNQQSFLRDVPRILAKPLEATREGA